MKKTGLLLTVFIILAALASSCFVWDAIKDRYQPYKVYDETKGGKKKVKFIYDSPSAKSVALVGEFNNWTTPGSSVPENETRNIVLDMEKNKESGFWERVMYLEPGKYQYKYYIDGGTWKYDQNTLEKTDDSFGGYNSLVIVQ